MTAPLNLFDDFPVLREEPLAKYTAARLGGAAQFLYIARDSEDHAGGREQLIAVVRRAWSAGVPVRILGGGANVLVSDAGVRGLVVINHLSTITFPEDDAPATVTATSGTALTTLARKCATRGLSGFEWAVSVPGTLGGAVVNNAGAHGGDMAHGLLTAQLIDAAGMRTLSCAELAYDYRTSALRYRADRRFLVMEANIALTRDDPVAIQARIENNIAHRKRTQPQGASLGSTFKNPPGDYAGRLIEVCSLKGVTRGGAMVSPVHANFFINTGKATARDYAALIEHVQRVVFDQVGVWLETEIEFIGVV